MMVKKLIVAQTILLILLGISIALLGVAIYMALRDEAETHYQNARFVSAPVILCESRDEISYGEELR